MNKLNLNKIKKNILLFISYFLTFSLLEASGGYILEFLHGYYLWDYSIVPLHIGKYISIPTSLLWATMAFVYLYLIKKYSDKLVKIIPKWLTIVLSLIFVVDFILTLIKLFNIKAM